MRPVILLLIGLILTCIFTAGCMETGVGEIVYEDSAFQIRIGDDLLLEEVTVQIIIFRIEGVSQEEDSIVIERRKIAPGDSILVISAPLSEGVYKAHLLIFSEGKRIAGRIIDVAVES